MGRLPGDQSWVTAAFAGALIGILATMRHATPVHVATWEAGAFGEQRTAKELGRLEAQGWVILHDLANGSANFDHVVIGPHGVFCLNSKWSGYNLHVNEDGRLVGRHRCDEEIVIDVSTTVRRARAEAAALSQQIRDRCGEKVWVQPVVVWWGEVENGGRKLDGVGVVQGDFLVERLLNQQGRPVRRFDDVVDALRPGRHARRRT